MLLRLELYIISTLTLISILHFLLHGEATSPPFPARLIHNQWPRTSAAASNPSSTFQHHRPQPRPATEGGQKRPARSHGATQRSATASAASGSPSELLTASPLAPPPLHPFAIISAPHGHQKEGRVTDYLQRRRG